MTETNNIEQDVTTGESQEIKSAAPEKETKWYVLRVVSGKERKVKEYLDKDIIRNGWDKLILQVFLLFEIVYKV
jgi:transcriptional antiterminator NusG